MSKQLFQSGFWSVSLRVKVLIPVLLVVVTLFVSGQYFSIEQSVNMQRQQQVEHLKTVGNKLAHAYLMVDLDPKALNLGLDLLPEVINLAIYSPDAQLRVSLKGMKIKLHEEQLHQLVQAPFWQTDNELIVTTAILEQHHDAVLVIRAAKPSLSPLIQQAIYQSILFVASFLIVWVVFCLTLNRLMLKPISQLSTVMQQVTNRHQRNMLKASTERDEIGELFNSFNQMIERQDAKEAHLMYALRKLDAEKSFADQVLDTVRFATLVVDNEGKIVHNNKPAEDLLNTQPDELLSANIATVTKGELTIETILQSLTSAKSITFDSTQILNIRSSKLPELSRYLVCIENITAIEHSIERDRVASSVFENNLEAMMIVDSNNRISMVNQAMTTLLDLEKDKCIGTPSKQVFMGQQLNEMSSNIELSVVRYGFWQGEITHVSRDGRAIPLFTKVSRIARSRDSDKVNYFYTFTDLSNIKEMERLNHLAHHDALTGLANRMKLSCVIANALAEPNSIREGMAILYIDLDGFKLINDSHGHDAGDFVLQQVATRMLTLVKEHDCVARLAGDEFVIMLRQISQQGVDSFALRLTETIGLPMSYLGHSMSVGVSIGVHYLTERETDLEQLLKQADSAMYAAKKGKKHRV
ncbi:diguanylate cyclase [Vibrio sp. 404]|uniref:Diguanylate cyclase n=1 Tax=Vibrio marinisediminis TaxID=2758441 RepID=A0A7W2FS55_9VIBR|nr:diguanylate cyclase [Vibrio marinisediminis]MBA5763261.1 diguanylate cyclase [Vibrio marinisediminis]